MNRVVPGIIMVLGWLLVAFGPVWLLKVLVAVVASLALHEYFAMTQPKQDDKYTKWDDGYNMRFGAWLAALFVAGLLIYDTETFGDVFGWAMTMLVCGVLGATFFHEYGKFDIVRGYSIIAVGFLYIGLGSVSLILLAQQPHKALWLIFLVAITAGSDTGAYYSGRRFGGAKLCPSISPNKTWAGLWGGLAAGVLCGVLVHGLMHGPWGFFRLVFSAALLVLAGVAGDLAESKLKRVCGVKDSGTLLGGHGGVLDRIDSLLFAAPVLYFLVH